MSTSQATGGARSSFVIGTAGHVDHGKSTLVKALTGIDPDRLAEEKTREMTIDLGFAWLDLPSGRRVSVVDVPGHERFIKNMLAGVGGIDAAVLVIAADEGPMPQTTEHLDILSLLGIDRGIVAVTKTDLVDEAWVEFVTEEIAAMLEGTPLHGSPIVPLSAQTGTGLDLLVATLDQTLDAVPERSHRGIPWLPVDRVFTVSGFGTVVTGTLSGASLETGQDVVIMPGSRSSRIRGLQSHGQKTAKALPGNRVAINLTQVAVEDVRRGDVVTTSGGAAATMRLDLSLHLLKSAPRAIEQNDQVDLFIGASEAPAWLTLLDQERIEPGDTGWVQARLRTPIAVRRNDRFIIRQPSPSITIGGGSVVDPAPPRHKRFRLEVVGALETLAQGDPAELVLMALDERPRTLDDLNVSALAAIPQGELQEITDTLVREGRVKLIDPGAAAVTPASLLLSVPAWERLVSQLTALLAAYHAEQPLRRGMPREEVRRRLRLAGKEFDNVVATGAAEGHVVDEGSSLRLPSFRIELDRARAEAAAPWLAAIDEHPFSPPSPDQFGVGLDTAQALVELNELERAGDDIYFRPATFREMERIVLDLIDNQGPVTLSTFRDRVQTSRKYAQAVLETFDQRRITRRIGDRRVRYRDTRRTQDGAA